MPVDADHLAGQPRFEERAGREPVDLADHQFENKFARERLERIKKLEAAPIAQLDRGLQIAQQAALVEDECRRLDVSNHPGVQRQPRHFSMA